MLRVVPPSGEERKKTGFSLHITSETGVLQQVIVHTPGPEVELVSPDNLSELLFEDILFAGHARAEHLLMCSLIEKIIRKDRAVLQMGVLLREAFDEEAARFDFIESLCRIFTEANLQAYEAALKRLSPEELHHYALTGKAPLPVFTHPIPNLMFTRDVAAVVHDQIILSHPATAARARESIILRVILSYHPGFSDYRERVVQLPRGVTFEGGDLLVVAPGIVLIGHSERTSFGGLMATAQAIFDRTPVEHILIVDLPKKRSTMHLDTVFTMCTEDECVVFPPLLAGGNQGNVVHFTRSDEPGRFFSEVRPNLKQALEELLGYPLTFIPCGGNDPLNQEREQWTDGANFFAPAPGVVVGYERNHRTFEMMQKHGYRVVSARGFLSFYEESDFTHGEKIAVKLEGTELSRGRGGPRCLTLPLNRKPAHG